MLVMFLTSLPFSFVNTLDKKKKNKYKKEELHDVQINSKIQSVKKVSRNIEVIFNLYENWLIVPKESNLEIS